MKSLMLIFITALLIWFVVPTVSSQTLPKKQHNHKFYSQELNDYIYPLIKEYLSDHKQVLNETNSNKIVNDIQKMLIDYFNEKGMKYSQAPYVVIIKLENRPWIAYVLEVSISLYDFEDHTENFMSSLIYGKSFLIYIYNTKNMITVRYR